MLGMNANDALGYMEDRSVLDAVNRAADERSLVRSSSMDAQRHTAAMEGLAAVGQAVALKVSNDRYADLRADRNENVVHVKALQRTLERMILEHARVTGQTVEAVKATYNVVRTQHFNSLVNEGIEKGWFDHDPRLKLSESDRSWYVPKLDADHGF